jgi:ankyrin repeat protein
MLVDRYEVLKNQAGNQPLIWAAENRGDLLIGAFVSYKQGILLVQDMMGVIHRIPDHILSWYSWLQLNEPVRVCTDDLISIQYLGLDYDEDRNAVPIYNIVIDRAANHLNYR